MPKNPLSALLSKLYTIFKKKQLKIPVSQDTGNPVRMGIKNRD